ncbi:MAG: MltA domain-containing protein, partial [Thermoanaerobaculia bacterium]|nr:MltA domain-containing protein [Thermoanaerobaculia bacterium]
MTSPDPRLRRWRLAALIAIAMAVITMAAALSVYVRSVGYEVIPLDASLLWPKVEPAEPPPDQIRFAAASFEDLPGWGEDDLDEALPALRASCRRWERSGLDREIGDPEVGLGTVAEWKSVCDSLSASPGGRAALEATFRELLTPLLLSNHEETEGLFTGYYEASLRGSRRRHGPYTVPLHSYPPDLVSVDLGEFRPDLKGTRIAGTVVDRRLVPFADRQAIVDGALSGRGLEILWVDDAVDAFFLHIQGSGRVELDDGTSVRLGYAGQNGHPYTAIGRDLIARGIIPREEMSMQAIRGWLAANPDEAETLMNSNASYVFQREIRGAGPLGAMGIPLTPERSLAVDPHFVPLGLPLWLEAEAPYPGAPLIRRLVSAQD